METTHVHAPSLPTDPFPERAEAVRSLAAELGWTPTAVTLASLEARGDSFVTGHVVDALDGGAPCQHTVYLESELPSPAAGHTIQSPTGERLTAWLYPADPALPALANAVDRGSASALLATIGLDPAGLSMEVLSYRPGKRAVIRATCGGGTVYLKVVCAQRVAALRDRHTAWREHGIPVPAVRSWTPEGMLVLDPLPGTELIGLLDRLPGDDSLISAVHDLSAAIATVPSLEPARPSLSHRLDWYRSRIAQLSPQDEARTHAVCDVVALALAGAGPAPASVTVHGDLHLAQLFAHRDDPLSFTGVLDIDTAGLGDPADDAAALVARLLASADLAERSLGGVPAMRARGLALSFTESWADNPDPGFAVRARAIAATHMLGHGLSGSLSAPRCLELAEWMLHS